MKDNKLILDKIKKVLDTNELKTFNQSIKQMIKESTEKNIEKVKSDFEKKSQKLITESKEAMEDSVAELVTEMVAEELATLENKEKSKQIKLIKENKNLNLKIKTLNKNVEDLKQTLKIKNNRVASLENETTKDVINESMMYGGVDLSQLVGIHGNETTTLNQVNKNLSNEVLDDSVIGILNSLKNL